jgi:hypothetical protein
MPMSGDDEELEAFFAAEERERDAGMSDQEHDDPNRHLDRWAEARAGDDPRLAEALHELIASYRKLRAIGETGALREFTKLLDLPNGLQQDFILDTTLRTASRLPGGEIYKRLRALEGETGLKFGVLDRRRRQLQKEDEASQTD